MKVEIVNFMCHENLILEMDSFQIISADNGSGKSAIFHAINWCINGGTNNFIKTGCKNSSVSITIDSNTYKREVIKDKNAVYKNGVEICNTKDSLINLGINIPIEYFSQFDKLYLLNETPKNKADLLNSMFDIEDIERASTNIKKDIKDEKLVHEKLKLKNIKDLESLDKIKVKIDELERIEYTYKNSCEVFETLKLVKDKLSKINKVVDIITDDIDTGVYNKLDRIVKLTTMVKNYPNKINLDIDYKVLYNIENIIKLRASVNSVPTIIGLEVDTKELRLLEHLNTITSNMKINSSKIVDLNLEYAEINEKLKGAECPLCKKKI